MVESRSMVRGASPGLASAPQAWANNSRHLVQLADVAPVEAAQEGADDGWRLGRETEHAGGPAGAQHISVVDAVAAGKRGGQLRRYFVAGVGPA